MGHVALVTGVSRDLGARFARRLATDPTIDKVVGVDVVPPRRDLSGVKFVRADIRNPVIGKILAVEDVDLVVHMSVLATPGRGGGRTSMKETNVIGTMQLLAACQRAVTVTKLVLKSTTAVYGASPRDPAMFMEETPAQRSPGTGYAKDSVEVEGYVRGLARRRPDIAVTTLRMANLLGAQIDSPLGRYFRLPVIPTVMGFDPRLQLLHDADALDILHRASTGEELGVFNVAGSGSLSLSQCARRLGKPMLAVPAFAMASVGKAVARTTGADLSPDLVDFLTYGRGVDTSRVRETFGFEPCFSTPQTLAEFGAEIGAGPLNSDRVRGLEARVGSLISSRGGRDG